MKRGIVLLATMVVSSLCGTAHGTIWHVHPDSAISSIQAGIDSSSHGDTVLVYPETYVENINFNGKNIVVGSLFLTIGDTSYISSTVIDGNSADSVVTFANGEDSTALITGFTIQNGYADYGGGIHCDSSSPSLSNVTISENIGEYGGGISCRDGSSPSLTNVTISENASLRGGGIYCDGSSPSLTNVTISGNTARYGGGIGCGSLSNLNLTDVTISGNTAFYGGGISCDNSSPSLTNVTIRANTADYEGGGIYCSFYSSSSLTNVTIAGNTAGYGGGISCYESNPSLTNVTISGNTAEKGGGIYCSNSVANLVNCILWNDGLEEIYFSEYGSPDTLTISYSDIQGDSAGIVTNDNGTIYWLEGNIDEDPLFTGSGDHPFALTEGSPCIDAGTPDTAGLSLPPWDVLGNHRIWDGDGNGSAIIDMGAYEYGAPAVGIEDEVVLEPKIHTFLQNYPNPFSPQTTIRYGLARDSRVTLKVYNVLGQEVRVLVDQFQGAGTYSVVWDSRDNTGRKVSCGTYFLRLEAGEHTTTRKLSVMR